MLKALLLFFVSFVALGKDQPPIMVPPVPVPPNVDTVLFSFGEELLIKVNQVRTDRGLPLLWKSEQNICASSIQAAILSDENSCKHSTKPGALLEDRLKLCGQDALLRGEILACGFNTANDVVQAWLKSPAHSKIMLAPKYVFFGAAMIDGKWVLTFTD